MQKGTPLSINGFTKNSRFSHFHTLCKAKTYQQDRQKIDVRVAIRKYHIMQPKQHADIAVTVQNVWQNQNARQTFPPSKRLPPVLSCPFVFRHTSPESIPPFCAHCFAPLVSVPFRLSFLAMSICLPHIFRNRIKSNIFHNICDL